jgi:hypothetical protein
MKDELAKISKALTENLTTDWKTVSTILFTIIAGQIVTGIIQFHSNWKKRTRTRRVVIGSLKYLPNTLASQANVYGSTFSAVKDGRSAGIWTSYNFKSFESVLDIGYENVFNAFLNEYSLRWVFFWRKDRRADLLTKVWETLTQLSNYLCEAEKIRIEYQNSKLNRDYAFNEILFSFLPKHRAYLTSTPQPGSRREAYIVASRQTLAQRAPDAKFDVLIEPLLELNKHFLDLEEVPDWDTILMRLEANRKDDKLRAEIYVRNLMHYYFKAKYDSKVIRLWLRSVTSPKFGRKVNRSTVRAKLNRIIRKRAKQLFSKAA